MSNFCDTCEHSERHHGKRVYSKGRRSNEAGIRCVVKYCKCQGFVKEKNNER